MPLRDHFQPPLDDVHSWDELHGMWPAMIVRELIEVLMGFLESVDPDLGDEPPSVYAVSMRMRYEGDRRLMDSWYHPLIMGQPLPTLPVWLKETEAVSLALEASYEETCRALRIP